MTVEELLAAMDAATEWTPELKAAYTKLLAEFCAETPVVAAPLSATDRIMEEVAKSGWTPGLQHAFAKAQELDARGY
jgi:hypothetical protein